MRGAADALEKEGVHTRVRADRNASGRGTFHRGALTPPGEGARGDFRSGHGQSLFFHGHRRPLRRMEIKGLILKATRVDGIYDAIERVF